MTKRRALVLYLHSWILIFETSIGVESISKKKKRVKRQKWVTNRYDEEETSGICFSVYNYHINNLFHPFKNKKEEKETMNGVLSS